MRNVTFGDANGGGQVTSADATLLARHLADPDNVPLYDIRAMDLNGDGYIDGTDLVWLVRWLVGADVPPAISN